MFTKQDRHKGREGYVVKMSYNPFSTKKWSNLLALVFQFFNVNETFQYRSLSKIFDKAVQYNVKLLNVKNEDAMRGDVKNFLKKLSKNNTKRTQTEIEKNFKWLRK